MFTYIHACIHTYYIYSIRACMFHLWASSAWYILHPCGHQKGSSSFYCIARASMCALFIARSIYVHTIHDIYIYICTHYSRTMHACSIYHEAYACMHHWWSMHTLFMIYVRKHYWSQYPPYNHPFDVSLAYKLLLTTHENKFDHLCRKKTHFSPAC
jgi:hypothetical protein